MAKGQKTSPKDIYAVMATWAIEDNYSEVSRKLGIPISTVKKIVETNKDKEEFANLCNQKKEEFAKTADRIIGKALKRIEKDIDDEEKQIPINHLTTAVGTLFDKKSLIEGKPTANVSFTDAEVLDKLASLAGYKRND